MVHEQQRGSVDIDTMQQALVGEASACGFLCVRSSGFESSSGQVVRTHNPETEAKTFSMVRGVEFAHQFTSIVYPIGDEPLHRSITHVVL
jgi:hypothetical protein